MKCKKVIIIDDDASCLEVMKIIVDDLGCETFAFTTWKTSTIQDIINIVPDIIILDEWLEGIKGSEICVILKSVNQLRRIPVVLVSGMDELPEIAKKANADGFIKKPFTIAELEDMVRSL